jgi:hypothetical protein
MSQLAKADVLCSNSKNVTSSDPFRDLGAAIRAAPNETGPIFIIEKFHRSAKWNES